MSQVSDALMRSWVQSSSSSGSSPTPVNQTPLLSRVLYTGAPSIMGALDRSRVIVSPLPEAMQIALCKGRLEKLCNLLFGKIYPGMYILSVEKLCQLLLMQVMNKFIEKGPKASPEMQLKGMLVFIQSKEGFQSRFNNLAIALGINFSGNEEKEALMGSLQSVEKILESSPIKKPFATICGKEVQQLSSAENAEMTQLILQMKQKSRAFYSSLLDQMDSKVLEARDFFMDYCEQCETRKKSVDQTRGKKAEELFKKIVKSSNKVVQIYFLLVKKISFYLVYSKAHRVQQEAERQRCSSAQKQGVTWDFIKREEAYTEREKVRYEFLSQSLEDISTFTAYNSGFCPTGKAKEALWMIIESDQKAIRDYLQALLTIFIVDSYESLPGADALELCELLRLKVENSIDNSLNDSQIEKLEKKLKAKQALIPFIDKMNEVISTNKEKFLAQIHMTIDIRNKHAKKIGLQDVFLSKDVHVHQTAGKICGLLGTKNLNPKQNPIELIMLMLMAACEYSDSIGMERHLEATQEGYLREVAFAGADKVEKGKKEMQDVTDRIGALADCLVEQKKLNEAFYADFNGFFSLFPLSGQNAQDEEQFYANLDYFKEKVTEKKQKAKVEESSSRTMEDSKDSSDEEIDLPSSSSSSSAAAMPASVKIKGSQTAELDQRYHLYHVKWLKELFDLSKNKKQFHQALTFALMNETYLSQEIPLTAQFAEAPRHGLTHLGSSSAFNNYGTFWYRYPHASRQRYSVQSCPELLLGIMDQTADHLALKEKLLSDLGQTYSQRGFTDSASLQASANAPALSADPTKTTVSLVPLQNQMGSLDDKSSSQLTTSLQNAQTHLRNLQSFLEMAGQYPLQRYSSVYNRFAILSLQMATENLLVALLTKKNPIFKPQDLDSAKHDFNFYIDALYLETSLSEADVNFLKSLNMGRAGNYLYASAHQAKGKNLPVATSRLLNTFESSLAATDAGEGFTPAKHAKSDNHFQLSAYIQQAVACLQKLASFE